MYFDAPNFLEFAPDPIRYRKTAEILDRGWLFSFDNARWREINVPFCPQSELSKIGVKEKFSVSYYKKTFTVKPDYERVFLCFGAVDYRAEVYINGKKAFGHIGGYTPFSFDIAPFVCAGENELFLIVHDEETNVARGKQTEKDGSYGCFYTRVTGIWQPVWIEYRPYDYIKNFRFFPNAEDASLCVELEVSGKGDFETEIRFNDKKVGGYNGIISDKTCVKVSLSEKKLWGILKGDLYEVIIRFSGDTVYSYFGLREVGYDGYKFLLNGEEVYQKLVLVQGYYDGGIYTPERLSDMQDDIDRALRLGFNGMRLHQKLFDPRFLYLCDKAGIMVWGEFPSWGIDYATDDYYDRLCAEWKDALERDFNHPSIITWCPLNEVWTENTQNYLKYVNGLFKITKEFDGTRPCVDVSGGYHGNKTDVYDFHCYESNENLKKYLAELNERDVLDVPLLNDKRNGLRYQKGLPVNVSEFGGIPFGNKVANNREMTDKEWTDGGAWGYGNGETDGDLFVKRYRELAESIFACEKVSGFCYTQLYDVEQEQNGFYFYDRTDKLSEEQKKEIKRINSEK